MKISLIQLASNDQVQENLNIILAALASSVSAGADVAFLPENSLYFRLQEKDSFSGVKLDGPELAELQSFAATHKIDLHLGAFPLAENGSRSNASVWISKDKNKTPEVLYRKIHLFDIQLESQKAIRESDFFSRGKNISKFQIGDWQVASTVCYDLRFAELFYAQTPFDMVVVPSAFLPETGLAHWHVLLRARAIENQAYVVAAAQMSPNTNGVQTKLTFGHSLIVDPWGAVLLDLGASTETKSSPQEQVKWRENTIEISKKVIDTVRKQIPMKQHREERQWQGL